MIDIYSERNKPCILRNYESWKVSTVLHDKSLEKFTNIVQRCADACFEAIGDKSETYCSTGSVHVILSRVTYDEAEPFRLQLLITDHTRMY